MPMICPHCGKTIYRPPDKWVKQCEALFSELDLRSGKEMWNGRQVMNLAIELKIAKDTFEAFRIWEVMRQSGMLEGVEPEVRYRWWRVRR